MEKKFAISGNNWCRGDLVKIDCSDYDVPPERGIGIILASALESNRQGQLFPAYYVFNLSLQTAKKYYLYDLEIISKI